MIAKDFLEQFPRTCPQHVDDSPTICGKPAVAVLCFDEMFQYVCLEHAVMAEHANDGPVFWPKGDSITCPVCKKTSYNRNDVIHEYCGNCHHYHRDMRISIGDGPTKVFQYRKLGTMPSMTKEGFEAGLDELVRRTHPEDEDK